MHQHVAAAARGDQLEHLLRAAGDVVDGGGAGSQRLPRDLDREGVGGERAPRRRQPLDRRHQRRRLVLGRHRRPAARRHGADVEHVEARLDQRLPVGDRLLGRAAARPLEHRVDGDVDDPGPHRLLQLRVLSASRQFIAATVATGPMALRCVYTDLDGTLLGRGGSLFRDADGGFSLAQARGLEACHRAGVEVVIMSGRREPQVHEAARLMGQSSYIYEAGCAFAIEGETTLMTGEMVPDASGTIYEQMEERGCRRCSSSTSRAGSSTTPPGTPDGSSPTSSAARSTSTRPTSCSPSATRRPAPARQRRDRAPDGGDRGADARLPPGAEDGQQGGRCRRPRPRPRLRPRRCIAVGDSVEDLEVAAAVGRFFVVANGPENDPGLRAYLSSWDNVDGHRGSDGRRLLRGGRLDPDGAPLGRRAVESTI